MANNNYSASSSQPDEISLFLQQILLRSSNSSSSSSFPANQEPEMGRIYAPDPSWFQANVSSSSVGTLDNDPDEYDCESEENGEALVEEAAAKSTAPSRNSSKRSRAAEVHNLSEKRRRSRINEKMKALQNLIPNSNKTDKASMLDEAIEYLKQLQLQVQMLTMRNGLSLYPICLPGVPSMNVCETNKPLNTIAEKIISMDQNIAADTLLDLPNTCVKQALNADLSTIIGSRSSFEIESSPQGHFGSYHFSHISTTGICPEEVLPCQQLNEECSQTRLTGKGYCEGAKSTRFGTQASNMKDSTLDELLGGDAQNMLPNLLNNPILSRQLKNYK
ncbi:hypothetical protein ACJIZ3_014896 [Penstemon smallii]|uniref:BHLH domain-containing protein n=1 Tax=Penstemon smallii TaxID=265156 RepID=A0ABD3RL74_9LAMI